MSGCGSTQTRGEIPSCGRKAQPRDNGSGPSSPRFVATQLHVSLYVSRPLEPLSLCQSPGRSEPVSVSLCIGPVRRRLGFQQPFVSPGWSESPPIFTRRYSSSGHGRCGPGSPAGAEAPRFSGGTFAAEMPWGPSAATHGCVASLLHISVPPPSRDRVSLFCP